MYYKVIKNNKVIDVLDNLIYLKWQPKHKIMVLTNETEAQAILSSDKNTIWHEASLYEIPVENQYDTVEIVEVNKYEYEKLKMLNGKTPEQIVDEVVLYLLQNNII